MTGQSQLDAFTKALEEWCNLTSAEVSYEHILSTLSNQIGCRDILDNSLDRIRDRAIFLIANQRIDEDFLVNAMVNTVSEFLQGQLSYHGRAILYNEEALEVIKHEDNDKHPAKLALERLKDFKYVTQKELELSTWEKIVSRSLSWYERTMWKNERDIKVTKSISEYTESIPDEIKELLWEFPIGELLKQGISYGDMSSLTVEQARKLREQILEAKQ